MLSFARFLLLICLFAVSTANGAAFGQSPWYEGFEGTDVSWRDAGGDVQCKILAHQRTTGAHTGQNCEWIQISADGGTAYYIAHDIGRPRVIEELLPTVWIKSDRPGLSISARVVLPRTTDPRTNKPMTTTIVGETMYNDVGRWQQLRIADIPKLVARQVRALRMQQGADIDDREAYLEAIFLNIYGGSGVTNVWIDDLDVAGYVGMNGSPAAQVAAVQPRVGNAYPTTSDGTSPFTAANLSNRFDIKLSVSVLMVDGKPLFPRAIEHQGEPLLLFKQLGFNAVWLKRLPTQELLEEADRLGLWLICPPPRPTRPDGSDDPEGMMNPIGLAFDRVLLWDLGDDLTAAQLPVAQRWAEQLRTADRRSSRPFICKPQSEMRGYSHLGNNSMLLLADRRPLGTSMELKDYGSWVNGQPRLAMPGTPMWTTVQTQPNETLRMQIAALDPTQPPPSCVSFEQMRLMAHTAVASGSRGLLFLSSTPLDAPDPSTRQRAMSLELLNLEMALVEPWAAASGDITYAKSSELQAVGAVLRAEHGRLLMPIWSGPGSQCVPGQSAANKVSFVTPVPEGCNAYEMTPGGLRDLPHPRVTGGLLVTFEEFSLTSQVLLANNPLVVNGLLRRSENIGQRAARLERDLAFEKFNTVQAVMRQLPRPPASVKQFGEWLESAKKNLQSCDRQLASKDHVGATLSADRAMRAMRMIERFYWDAAVSGLASPVTSPAAMSFETLPLHARLLQRIRSPHGTTTLLSENFEDPNTMLQTGWRNLPDIIPGSDPGGPPLILPSADLIPQAAHSGIRGLRLTATPTTPENPPAMIETPPVRFVSPNIPAQPGQFVCIHGWVKVPKAITGSVDGLMIYDNQGGEALAERIGQSVNWRQFALYRIVTQPDGVNVTFSLTGLGEAWIDDVTIDVLDATNPQ